MAVLSRAAGPQLNAVKSVGVLQDGCGSPLQLGGEFMARGARQLQRRLLVVTCFLLFGSAAPEDLQLLGL